MEKLNRNDVQEDNFDWKFLLTKTDFLDFPDFHVSNDRRKKNSFQLHWVQFVQTSWFAFRCKNHNSRYRDKCWITGNFQKQSHVFAIEVSQFLNQ